MHDPAERSRIVAEVAERAAAEIRARAEAEARRLSEERRRTSDAFFAERRSALAELDRATMHHLAVVKARTEELLGTLRATIERAAEPAPEPSASGASGRGPLLYHSTEATALAAQMTAAGSSRDDIVRALRERFGISEAEPLADEEMARYGS